MKRTGNGHEAWVGSQLRASLARYGSWPVWVGFALRVLRVAALRWLAGCLPAGRDLNHLIGTNVAGTPSHEARKLFALEPIHLPSPFLSPPVWTPSCTSVRFLPPSALVVIRAAHGIPLAAREMRPAGHSAGRENHT